MFQTPRFQPLQYLPDSHLWSQPVQIAEKSQIDRFARLRQMGFEKYEHFCLLNGFSELEHQLSTPDILTYMTNLEYDAAHAFKIGIVGLRVLHSVADPYQRNAVLRGMNRSGVCMDPIELLKLVSESDANNALIRHALERSLAEGITQSFREALRTHILNHQKNRKVQVTLLDIAAEYRVDCLKTIELLHMLSLAHQDELMMQALLRYIGAVQAEDALPWLHEMLAKSQSASAEGELALLDALGKIGSRESERALQAYMNTFSDRGDGSPSGLLKEFAELVLMGLHADGEESRDSAPGLVVVQCMFQGAVGQAGKGDSGGLGVFLASLGNALARTPGIGHVYTLVLLNVCGPNDRIHLIQDLEQNHSVLHIPLAALDGLDQREMMAQEGNLRSAIRRTLQMHAIRPDVFHLRYADHGSLAALRVAREMGKKVIFTLTADPHRTLADRYQQLFLGEEEMDALDFVLQRIFVADHLLEQADGLVVMPTGAGLDPLTVYFPQFLYDPDVQTKPLQVLSEGIQLWSPEQPGMPTWNDDPAGLLSDLYSLFAGRPVMLNVGRLNPIKQQHLLVEAWASSGLWQRYNLVLIGGNLENPNPVEAEMLALIAETFERFPQSRPYFYFLPAMNNDQVRRLEASIIHNQSGDQPHLYVCSSVKEEFGIAVLEAMDAGFLVVGPQRGGLSSYIQHGYNGFLMDTSSADGIALALCSILSSAGVSSEDLHQAAAVGQETVRANFDIDTTAQAFADFYRKVGIPVDVDKKQCILFS